MNDFKKSKEGEPEQKKKPMSPFGSVGESVTTRSPDWTWTKAQVGPPDHQLNGGVWVVQRGQRQRWKTAAKGREGDVKEVDRREEE